MKIRECPKVQSIYQWASEYTAESIFEKSAMLKHQTEDFYETEDFKRIMFKAINQRRGLIGILGLQGSGKTRTLKELGNRLWTEKQNTFYIKWSKDVFERMKEWDILGDIVKDIAKDRITLEFESYARAYKCHPKLGRVPQKGDFLQVETGEFDYEQFFSKAELKELTKQAVYLELGHARYLMIDMPDYTKSTAHSMNRDIDNVQELWQRIQADMESRIITFIIAFQKEMVMKHPHFFIGKLDIVTLKPLKPEELIEAYKLRNKTVEPFTEDALHLIGEFSRGIFRRFLKYIAITIEKNLEGFR